MYEPFLSSATKNQWRRVGIGRRAGVITPLFSIYSKNSVGIGDFEDLKLLADWCKKSGLSIIQLLPLNDVGFDFRPYDAQSTIALEPMYLSLSRLSDAPKKKFDSQIRSIQKNFPIGRRCVNYGIKQAKLELLRIIFKSCQLQKLANFRSFSQQHAAWLDEYVLFKVIQEEHHGAGWEDWPEGLKARDPSTLKQFCKLHTESLDFHRWLQWQLFEQFKDAACYAKKQGVLLMGDLPFLVSRNSADVWAHQNYFKLDLSSGAPPDPYYALGQRWGMPPYNWNEIIRDQYQYLKEKLRYASNFYDIYRIDHVVGAFRIWTISLSEPRETHGLKGVFDPADESKWEEHGRRLLSAMIENCDMLPCGEDLGVIPDCCFKTLKEFGIPGIDVQRWIRDWDKSHDFKEPMNYRENSIATISTHDMTALAAWWKYEAGTVDEELFMRKCREKGIDFNAVEQRLFNVANSGHGRLRWKKEITSKERLLEVLRKSQDEAWELVNLYLGTCDEKGRFWRFLGFDGSPADEANVEFVKRALEKANQAASIFSIQLLQDYLSLADLKNPDLWNFRINFPGTLNPTNWTLQVPYFLEEMMSLPMNRTIAQISRSASRV